MNKYFTVVATYRETDLDIEQPVTEAPESEKKEPAKESSDVPVRRVSFQLDNLPHRSSGYLCKGRRLAKTAECLQFYPFLSKPIFFIDTLLVFV